MGIYGTILRTTNGGLTWISQNGATNWLRGVSFTDANTGTVVGEDGTILRTTDGGSTWISLSSGTTFTLFDVCFTDVNTGTAVGDYSIYVLQMVALPGLVRSVELQLGSGTSVLPMLTMEQ